MIFRYMNDRRQIHFFGFSSKELCWFYTNLPKQPWLFTSLLAMNMNISVCKITMTKHMKNIRFVHYLK